MILIGSRNATHVIASMSSHDFITAGDSGEESYIMRDGGQPSTMQFAGYTRGWGERVIFEVPQSFAELYNDYNYNRSDRKYGIWKIEDVRIISNEEYKQIDTVQALRDNAIWGTNGESGDQPTRYVHVKDCTIEHLQNILKDCGHRISGEMEDTIKYWIASKDK